MKQLRPQLEKWPLPANHFFLGGDILLTSPFRYGKTVVEVVHMGKTFRTGWKYYELEERYIFMYLGSSFFIC